MQQERKTERKNWCLYGKLRYEISENYFEAYRFRGIRGAIVMMTRVQILDEAVAFLIALIRMGKV